MALENHKILPIMLALCLMLLPSYYAQNYAGIIGSSLPMNKPCMHVCMIANANSSSVCFSQGCFLGHVRCPQVLRLSLIGYGGKKLSKMVGNSASKLLNSAPNKLLCINVEWWRIVWKKLYAFSRYTAFNISIGISKYL